jgi:hypothetical protein
VSDELVAGLAAGAVCAAVVGLAGSAHRAGRRSSTRPLAIAGVPAAGCVLLVLAAQGTASLALVVGTAGIGFAAAATRVLPRLLAALAALPFACVLVADLEHAPAWLRFVGAVIATAIPIGAARTDAQWRADAVTPALVAVTAAGVYLVVPDTEEVAVLVGVMAPIAVLGWPFRLATLGRAGTGAAIALVVWAAGVGGRAVPATALGALACLALLAGLPLAEVGGRRRRARAGHRSRTPTIVMLLVVHAALALAAARLTAGDRSVERAAVVAATTGVASTVAGARFSRLQGV